MAGDYYGLPTRALSNRFLTLEFLEQAGPRIVRLVLAGSNENLLAEQPHGHRSTQYGEYYFRGGHRLWHSPELVPQTYVPDNEGLQIELHQDGARLVQPVEAPTGIRKSINIDLSPDRPIVTLTHTLKNEGHATAVLAPWAITQLALGGTAILPRAATPLDGESLQPNRAIVLWPYTQHHDPRLEVHEDYFLVRANPKTEWFKIGYLNHTGWIAYARDKVLFIKRFDPQPSIPHPDFACNAEVWSGPEFIEVETLGRFGPLEPGQSVTHVETWEIRTGTGPATTIDEIRELVRGSGV